MLFENPELMQMRLSELVSISLLVRSYLFPKMEQRSVHYLDGQADGMLGESFGNTTLNNVLQTV